MSDKNSYKSTIKSTAIFGGAQAVQMLITVVRAKIIAVIFGSYGMGVNAIFQSTVSIISSFSSFGIFQSAVRDISQKFEINNVSELSRIIKIFRRIVWVSGLLGLALCAIGAYLLSRLAFESGNYTLHFIILSVAIFFSALANGETVVLQGTRNLATLAKSSLTGAFLSLLISVPLFHYFGIFGIVVSIVLGYLLLYLTQVLWSRKLQNDIKEEVSVKETIDVGMPIVKLGAILMLGTVILTGFTYITNVFIGRYGTIADVGYFQGISSITNQSIAIVIAVLASDFFPRLSAVYLDKSKVKEIVNQQAELVSLIIAPISMTLIVLAPLVVNILLSNEFVKVVPLLRLLAISLLFKGIWLIMSYIILANGDKKAYILYDSIIGNGLLFVCNIIAYIYWGLEGLALSSLIASVVIAALLTTVVNRKYDFAFDKSFVRIFMFLILLVSLSYANVVFVDGWAQYIISAALFAITLGYALYELNKKIGFLNKLRSIIRSRK